MNMGLRPHFDFWQTTRFKIPMKRTLVMGIVNVTPDSFSSLKTECDLDAAIDHAKRLLDEGADILDVGGESTRPGATPISSKQEWARVHPVLDEVLKWNIPISMDTYHAENMQKALDSGLDIVNDIYALRVKNALDVVAPYTCGICLMHMHGQPLSMQNNPISHHVVDEVISFFTERLTAVEQAGVSRDRIVIDPGVGFGKTMEQNFQLLNEQSEFLRFKLPLLVGWSRKSSLGAVTGLSVKDRMVPSVTAALIAAQNGASIVRVHDVKETISALKVWQAAETFSETH